VVFWGNYYRQGRIIFNKFENNFPTKIVVNNKDGFINRRKSNKLTILKN